MTTEPPDLDVEFDELLAKACDGEATTAEREQAQAFAAADPDALEEYVAHMLLASELRYELSAPPNLFSFKEPSAKKRPLSIGINLWLPAVAAVLFAAYLVLRNEAPDPVKIDDSNVAAVPSDNRALASFAMASLVVGKPTGEWGLTEGSSIPAKLFQLPPAAMVELQFDSGVVARVQGPALFRVSNSNALELRYGHVNAEVPPEGIGFTIETPLRRIVDLGTDFDVWIARDGMAKIYCSKGTIAIQEHGSDILKELTAGQGIIYPDAYSQGKTDNTRLPPIGLPPEVKGDIRFISYIPKDLRQDNEEALELICFAEQVNLTLPVDVTVEHQRPGLYDAPAETAEIVPAGTSVDCYLAHFDPPKATETGISEVMAVLTFQQRVLGVVSDTKSLLNTDELFGATDYSNQDIYRGVDYGHADFIRIGDDGHSVGIHLKGQVGTDQIRILVESASKKPDLAP